MQGPSGLYAINGQAVITALTENECNALSRDKRACVEYFFQVCETDRVDVAAALLKQYDALPSTYAPRILFADGPESAKNMLAHFFGLGKETKYYNHIDVPFGSLQTARNIADEIFMCHVGAANKQKERFNRSFSDPVRVSLRNMVLYDLNRSISAQVVQPVLKSIENAQKEPLNGFRFRPSIYPSWLDADWTHFYQLCDRIFGTQISTDGYVSDFIGAGGFMVYAYDLFAIAVPRPDALYLDDRGRLHNEDGPAVSWEDGTAIYYWNGVEIPPKLIEDPNRVTRDDIITENNAEVRRCYLEALGSEQFGSLLGLRLIDQSTDRYGNELKLYRTAERDKIAGDFIYFGAVVCPSTFRSYFLCVPPHIKTAREAVSWTFGKTPKDYNPDIET